MSKLFCSIGLHLARLVIFDDLQPLVLVGIFIALINSLIFQAQVAQQQHQQESFSTSNSAVTSTVSSSPVTSLTSVPPLNGMVGPPQPPSHPPHPHFPPHPPGLPHPGQHPPPHPHFHPHLGMEPPRPRFLFKMPRVVPNQKEKYESEDLMKRHSREGEVSVMAPRYFTFYLFLNSTFSFY